MFQSWYLSVDTQLFIIAPFIIYPLWKWVRWGRVLLVVSTVATIAISFTYHLIYNLDPTVLVFASELPDFQYNYYFLTAYIKTHVRAFSYFLGLALGYTIYALQKSKINISKPVVIVSWILAIIVGATALSSIVIVYDHENRLSAVTSAIYSVSSKLLWNISIGWIILACLTGNGGIFYKVLSLPVFQPLARLTYCAFLVNGFIVTYGYAAVRHNIAMNFYELVSSTWIAQVGNPVRLAKFPQIIICFFFLGFSRSLPSFYKLCWCFSIIRVIRITNPWN